jgi:hypothetical protein
MPNSLWGFLTTYLKVVGAPLLSCSIRFGFFFGVSLLICLTYLAPALTLTERTRGVSVSWAGTAGLLRLAAQISRLVAGPSVESTKKNIIIIGKERKRYHTRQTRVSRSSLGSMELRWKRRWDSSSAAPRSMAGSRMH